jgi:5-methylcytosine-specific restriction endonuclease McrA
MSAETGKGRLGSALPQSRPWRQWYQLEVWRRRRRHQLKIEPLCAFCLQHGALTLATIADHIEPHGGSWNHFRLGPLQSLCKLCHDRVKRGTQRRGFDDLAVDADGWPTDPKHPANDRTMARNLKGKR